MIAAHVKEARERPPMGMRILLAIDNSHEAALAVDLVAGTRWPEGSRVHVRAVQDAVASFGNDRPPSILAGADEREAAGARARSAAGEHLSAAVERLEARGLNSEAEPPLTDRQRVADRIGAELLRRAPGSVLAIPVDRGAGLSQAAHR